MKTSWKQLLYMRVYRANQKYPGTLTVADLEAAIEKSGRVCYWCKKPNLDGRDLTIEHLERRNAPEAITIACFACNQKRLSFLAADAEPLPACEQAPRWNQERWDSRMDEPEVPLTQPAW